MIPPSDGETRDATIVSALPRLLVGSAHLTTTRRSPQPWTSSSTASALDVQINRHQLSTHAFLLDPSMWRTCVLRPFSRTLLAKTNDADRHFIVGELTEAHELQRTAWSPVSPKTVNYSVRRTDSPVPLWLGRPSHRFPFQGDPMKKKIDLSGSTVSTTAMSAVCSKNIRRKSATTSPA